MTIAVYAGSFDPPTLGHLNIVERASAIWDEVIVAVGRNDAKKHLFDTNERVEMMKQAIKYRPVLGTRKIAVCYFQGLLVHACKFWGATVMVRGLRAGTEFDYEFAIAQGNASQDHAIHTVFLPTEPQYAFVSSSLVKEIARNKGNVREFVDPAVAIRLDEKFATGQSV